MQPRASSGTQVQLVVGLSGRTGSGKSTVAEHLARRGFVTVAFRSALEDLLRAEGVPATRGALRELGREVRHTRGQRWLDERIAESVDRAHAPRVTLDGLRFPEDHYFFADRYERSFTHLHVVASEEARRERFMARGGSGEEFQLALAHETEASVEETGELAAAILSNDGSLADLQHAIDRLHLRAEED